MSGGASGEQSAVVWRPDENVVRDANLTAFMRRIR